MRKSSKVESGSERLSINELSWRILENFLRMSEFYGIRIGHTASGATIVDTGVNARGGYEAGRLVTEICMGGCASVEITISKYGSMVLPSIFVRTDHPALATFGSQLAGWRIRGGEYSAIGSGPARALALKPKKIFEKISYEDDFDHTIVALETDKMPPDLLLNKLARECHISVENLAAILMPTCSIAGTVQISGRIVEVGMHKLEQLGLDPNTVMYACGSAPIAPPHPEFANAMSMTNDAILYGGTVYLTVDFDDDATLKRIVDRAPSEKSENYGKPFLQILHDADNDFYKVDRGFFAPAVLIINNIRTGKTFRSGHINAKVLAESLGF